MTVQFKRSSVRCAIHEDISIRCLFFTCFTHVHSHAHTHSHFKCISQHYILPQALEIMCVLLREIMSEVLDRDEQSLVNSQQEEAEEPHSRRVS